MKSIMAYIILIMILTGCYRYIDIEKPIILNTLHEVHFSKNAQMCMSQEEKESYASNNLAIRTWKAQSGK